MSQESQGSIQTKISIKALAIIAILGISYQFYISQFVNEDEVSFADFSYGLSGLAVGITGIFVAKRYRGSPVFGKSYFALAIGFILLFAGDLTYNYYSIVLNEDPYPSLAEVFWFAFYFFVGYHLIKNIRYFKKELGLFPKLGVPALAGVLVVAFAVFTIDDLSENPIEWITSEMYVVASATMLSLAVLGLTVFRNSVLGIAWFMLVVGIFTFSFADVWYYYLEDFEEYTIVHPVNTLWVVANIFMIYSLYKHKKTI